ncbi:rab11 family-interacting protein 2 [Neodiprion virginianus]|uniref:rab11 family-interacting protein 2 n=1 Tax=Neodiprion fabricii TaxID=2872261 RepID=UPI00076FCF2A|nr:rab11 family-interacting protein 2 [Neodiprion fabricii]XP_046618779.1 rab11 family-interacting protein 2 [Neodiprion virginianus]
MWSPTHVQVTVQRAKGLLTKGKNKTNDCFVTIALGKEKYQTSVKEKVPDNVEWHEECELQIPQQGNTAEVVLTVLHRNFLGVDEFLGMVNIPLSTFDVYERPKNRWYVLNTKPGKENTKERGELEVKIGFIVKAGSLMDLSKKERHKSSLGQLSSAAHSIGGSLLSIGSLEKRKGLKKLAKSIGNKVKGKSKSKLDQNGLDEREEHEIRPSKQEPGEADPGVISEDEDEFTFDDLSHKSSASSLNAPNNGAPSEPQTTPPITAVSAPNKPPRYTAPAQPPPFPQNTNEDEWGQKLYGKHGSSTLKRWEEKTKPKIQIDEPREEREDISSNIFKAKEFTEPPSPAPRDIFITTKNTKEEKLPVTKSQKDEKLVLNTKNLKDDKSQARSPKEEKHSKKDKKKDKEQKNKDSNDCGLSSERIIIGGEDSVRNLAPKSRLSNEILSQFDGKSREDLIELTLQLQREVADKKKRLGDLEDYIDSLLLRVIESSPRLLQNPYQSQRRLSSPGHQ